MYLELPNGRRPAEEALESLTGKEGTRVRAKLRAFAQRLADHGHLAYEKGHWLEGPFAQIYEFKPDAYRVMAFKHGKILRVSNVAKKAKPLVQARDYALAERLRVEWIALNQIEGTQT